MSILFKNADILLTEDEGFSVIRGGYLGVKGAKIAYIGQTTPEEPYDEVIDAYNKLLMPGLINTHCHLIMTLLRGQGSDLPLQAWLQNHIYPIEDRLTSADGMAGSELGLLEMISTGTTSFTDMYNFNDETIDAVIRSGLKINDAYPILSFNPDDDYDTMPRVSTVRRLYETWNGAADGRVKIDHCIHGEYTCTPNVVRRHTETCLSVGGRMHIHLSETKVEHENCVAKYGKTPARWFYDLGLFDNPTCAAHCVWVTAEDIHLMAEKKVNVMHNPSSNMKLGSGFAPVEHMRMAGINVALGTDGAASNNNLNMFEELHMASIIHNGAHLDPTIVKADTALRMATINGAILQGREDTGMLKEGYRADIIAVDLDRPHLIPGFDVPSMLCYTAQGSDVCMNMVDGKILYKDGTFLTLDKERILHDAREALTRLYGHC